MIEMGNFIVDFLSTFIRSNNMIVNPIMKYNEEKQEFERKDKYSFIGSIDDANVIHLEYIDDNKIHINSKILSRKIFELLKDELNKKFNDIDITIYDENNRTCMNIKR